MHERNDNIELIGGHRTGPWLVPARLPLALLPALATSRERSLHGRTTPAVVSARTMQAMAMVQARRAARGAT